MSEVAPEWISEDINVVSILSMKVCMQYFYNFLMYCPQFQECSCKDISFGSVNEVLVHGCHYDRECAKTIFTFDTTFSKMV